MHPLKKRIKNLHGLEKLAERRVNLKTKGKDGQKDKRGVKFDPFTSKKDVPCRYFNTPDGCRIGQACHFKHA